MIKSDKQIEAEINEKMLDLHKKIYKYKVYFYDEVVLGHSFGVRPISCKGNTQVLCSQCKASAKSAKAEYGKGIIYIDIRLNLQEEREKKLEELGIY